MVALKKRHRAPRRKQRRPVRQALAQKAPKASKLTRRRPAKTGARQLAEDAREPKPEELAKEEAIKPEELEAAIAIAPKAEAEEPAPRERERGSYDGDTAIKLYLREIGQVKLLTPQEEIELAARIKKGDKKAREQMIKANLRLVVKIARDYEGIGLPLLDLISEGNIGLMKAVERFDPAKGGKLSTYGSWWIKQSIKRALANQSKTIRLPVHLVDKISKMRRTAMRLQEELGREPTDEELAEELGITAVARGADAHGRHPPRLARRAHRRRRLQQLRRGRPGRKRRHALRSNSKTRPSPSMLREMVKTLDTARGDDPALRGSGWTAARRRRSRKSARSSASPASASARFRTSPCRKLRKMIEKLEAQKK